MRYVLFIVVALLSAAVFGILAWAAPLARLAMQCNQDRASDAYLAYCENQFGDYEHAALYFGLERRAIRSLQNADVVVLGSSLAQFAFSTDQTAKYFENSNLAHYLFGFGYNESSPFPLSILSRLNMKARVYVLHTFAFFGGTSSVAAAELTKDDAFAQNVRRMLGADLASTLCGTFHCGASGSIFRTRTNGHWLWQKTLTSPVGAFPVPEVRPKRPLPTNVDFSTADKVVRELGLDPSCLILTTTPSSQDWNDYTEAMASYMNAVAIIPRLNGLSTIDHEHIDGPSATRWSNEFFRMASDTIVGCTRRDNKSANR